MRCRGIVELLEDGNGLIVYQSDNYQIRPASAFLPKVLVRRHAIRKGTLIEAQLHPRRKPLPEDAMQQLKKVGAEEHAIDDEPNTSKDPDALRLACIDGYVRPFHVTPAPCEMTPTVPAPSRASRRTRTWLPAATVPLDVPR